MMHVMLAYNKFHALIKREGGLSFREGRFSANFQATAIIKSRIPGIKRYLPSIRNSMISPQKILLLLGSYTVLFFGQSPAWGCCFCKRKMRILRYCSKIRRVVLFRDKWSAARAELSCVINH